VILLLPPDNRNSLVQVVIAHDEIGVARYPRAAHNHGYFRAGLEAFEDAVHVFGNFVALLFRALWAEECSCRPLPLRAGFIIASTAQIFLNPMARMPGTLDAAGTIIVGAAADAAAPFVECGRILHAISNT